MNAAWIWFGLAALALIGEVMSGTFYLLMVAAGFAVAGAAAWFGVDIAWQIIICAVAVVVCTLVLRRTGVLRKRGSVQPSRNADINMDIGQTVRVDTWNAERVARVWYRGAHWEAELAPGEPAQSGLHVIVEMNGNRLVVRPQA